MIYDVKSVGDLGRVSRELQSTLLHRANNTICLLYGPMGAGKTTLVTHILDGLITDSVSSPTFSIMNIYQGLRGEKHLHLDLYRKESISFEELRDLGMDILYENSNNLCFIEWPERMGDLEALLMDNESHSIIKIVIKKLDDLRQIVINM